MDETSSDGNGDGMSFLEMLREGKIVLNPINFAIYSTAEEEAREKMNLILEHQSEFPSKLRPSIEEAAALAGDSNPERFLDGVYEAVKIFIQGRSIVYTNTRGIWDGKFSKEWHGLDSDVDTEEEAELAIRFFPRVLVEGVSVQSVNHGICKYAPIYLLTSHPKAVSFVPLFAKLLEELTENDSKDVFAFKLQTYANVSHGNGRSVAQNLLFNDFKETDLVESPSAEHGEESELDEECLAVLMRIQKDGLVHAGYYGIYLMDTCIVRIFCKVANFDIDYIETRLRLLVDWDRTILINQYSKTGFIRRRYFSLLEAYLNEMPINLGPPRSENKYARIFEVIVELAISHYPLELGFVFHKLQQSEYTNFSLACNTFGIETVTQIIKDKVLGTLQHNGSITMKTLLFAATINKKVSPDGVFTLLCCNPMALLSDSDERICRSLFYGCNRSVLYCDNDKYKYKALVSLVNKYTIEEEARPISFIPKPE